MSNGAGGGSNDGEIAKKQWLQAHGICGAWLAVYLAVLDKAVQGSAGGGNAMKVHVDRACRGMRQQKIGRRVVLRLVARGSARMA